MGLIIPYADMSREDLWERRMGILDRTFVTTCVTHIISGVAYLHSKSIVHRDLKPANTLLLLTPAGHWQVKVGDFGSTRGIQPTGMTVGVGTPGYAAPEDVMGMRTGLPIGVWSIGVMLREMAIGCRVWQRIDSTPCGTLVSVAGVMEPPPADIASVPKQLRAYATAYQEWARQKGGSLDTWNMYNRRVAKPDPTHKMTAGLMLQLCPGARTSAVELMSTDVVRQSRVGRKRERVKIRPPPMDVSSSVPGRSAGGSEPPSKVGSHGGGAPGGEDDGGGGAPPCPVGSRGGAASNDVGRGAPPDGGWAPSGGGAGGAPCAQALCQCKRSCDNADKQHWMIKTSSRWQRGPCVNTVGASSPMADICRCKLCGKGRWMGEHCFTHCLEGTGPTLPLFANFGSVMAQRLPSDMRALMAAGVSADHAAFYMQSMLWEPWAAEAFAEAWETAGGKSRPERLQHAGHAAIRAAARVKETEPDRYDHAMSALSLGGACRWFGCLGFGKDMGLPR